MSVTSTHSAGQDALTASGLPLFFEVGNFNGLGCALPDHRGGQAVRVWARSLTVMQKEAVVYAARSGKAWRLASDEGPYLQGHDVGPCPLAFLTTGMISSYMNEISAALARAGVTVRSLELVQDNHYTMEGSALAGTMAGSALPVALEIRIASDAGIAELDQLLAQAVRAAPADGLLRGAQRSLFTLTHNGVSIAPARAATLDMAPPAAPRAVLGRIRPLAGGDPGWVSKLSGVATGGESVGLQNDQKRTVHLRATCRLRADGVKEIVQEMDCPQGSTFRFHSDESPEFGGGSRAPDAASYLSAGIAFCFMTQLGRYARIRKKDLRSYDIIQDTHLSAGHFSGGRFSGNNTSDSPDRSGSFDPVETHLYLDSGEDDEFARACLDMGEQTCYLHALCRTPLRTRLSVRRLA